MKWFLIIVLIVVIMIIAKAVSDQYREKYDFYYNLKIFFEKFKINLSFKQEKLNDFLNEMKFKKNFNIFIQSYKEFLHTNQLNLSNIKILDEEEKNQLDFYLKNIGKHDTNGELLQLDSFLSEINQKVKKCEQDKNKLCPMILKLSLLFAIGVGIILI